jgi:hypothetical protein
LTSNGRTLAQGALAWIWGRSERTIPIPGFKNVQQAEENARALAFGRAHLCLRQSRHGSLTGRHWRGQGKLREEKSALHRVEDFSLPLEITG